MAPSSSMASKSVTEVWCGTSTNPSRSSSVVNDRASWIQTARPGVVRMVDRSSASVTNSSTSRPSAGGFRT